MLKLIDCKCQNCETVQEVFAPTPMPKIDEELVLDCPTCDHPVIHNRVVNKMSFELKGGGWFGPSNRKE